MLNKKQVIARLRAFAKHGETPRRADLMEQAASMLDSGKDYAEGFRDGQNAERELMHTFLVMRGKVCL